MIPTHFRSFVVLFLINSRIVIHQISYSKFQVSDNAQIYKQQNNVSYLSALDFYASSIMGLHLNINYRIETISSSSSHRCDGPLRMGERSAFPQGSWDPLCLSKKTASWSEGNKSITAVCFPL